jgi:hypothetical protein
MIINTDHKGRNANGSYAWRPLLQAEPNDFQPDSTYWRRRGQGAVAELIGKMGTEAVEDWFDVTWPEGAEPSWWSIALRAEEKLHTLIIGQPEELSTCGH